ncbi:hypothetical protein BJ165DRAFT_1436618 [Panaeolus papilionaceus]|nr:hypothetical protein BJ165DRAFT_1436618 [Panaeolus papilionaceus]
MPTLFGEPLLIAERLNMVQQCSLILICCTFPSTYTSYISLGTKRPHQLCAYLQKFGLESSAKL